MNKFANQQSRSGPPDRQASQAVQAWTANPTEENKSTKFAGPLAQSVSDNRPLNPSTHQPINSSIQPINPSTHRLIEYI